MVKQDRYLNGIRNIIENKIGINALHREKFFADEYKQNIVPYEKPVLRYRFFRMFMPTGSQYIGSGVFSGVFVYRRKFSFESTDFDWRISDDVSIYGVFL